MLGCSGAKAGSERLRAERRVQLAGHDAERVQVGEERLGVGGERVEREVPAVGRAGQVLLQHAERRVHEPALVLVPAGDRRDVREVALGQEAQQLELRVDARLDAPERLQDQRLAEHDRGVGLLDADRAHLDRPALGRAPPDQRKPSVPSPACTSTLERIRCSSSRACAGSASAS